MNDLRKAAEMALKQLQRDDVYLGHRSKTRADAITALRKALAHEAMDRMVAENQRLGLYGEDNLQTAIEKGTKAWADVPNASEWVEELRGNDTPEEAFTLDRGCYERGCVAFDERDGDGVIMLGKRVHAAPYTKLDTTAGVLHKEWVGLTNEDIDDLWKTEYFNLSYELPRAIEAKLKEKNT